MDATTFKGFVENLRKHQHRLEISRQEFDNLSKEKQRAVKSVPYVIAGAPETSKAVTPLTGCFRTECFKKASLIALDIDEHAEALKAKAALQDEAFPFNHAWHETVTSRPQAQRLRVFIDADGIPGESYKEAVAAVARACRVESYDTSGHIHQPMFRPTCFQGENICEIHEGNERRAFTEADIDKVDPLEASPLGTALETEDFDSEDWPKVPPIRDLPESEFIQALKHIDPDAEYSTWILILAGLRHQYQNNPQKGLELAIQWSRGDYNGGIANKFSGEEELSKKWDSLKPIKQCGKYVTIRTVLHLAQEAGYEQPRKNPAINQVEPKTVYLPAGPITRNDTAAAIAEKVKPLRRFFRYAENVAVIDGDEMKVLFNPRMFSNLLEEHIYFKAKVKDREGGLVEKRKSPSKDTMEWILASRCLLEGLEPVNLIVRAPFLILAANGSLERLRRGYNPASGIFVAGNAATPPGVSLKDAVKALKDIFNDFNFTSEPDFSRAIANCITPALKVGGFIRDRVPLDLAEADRSQAGKGYRLQIVRAIYGEISETVTGYSGGVGSFDENVAIAVSSGRMFVLFDNIRGRLDSMKLEAYMTADKNRDDFKVRVPHKGFVSVVPGRTLFQMSSNGVTMTEDLANRSCIVRMTKQPDDYQFKEYPKGSVKDHVEANQAYFMGCINAVITEWHRHGMPSDRTGGTHDAREWHGKVNWIVTRLFDMSPIMQGHCEHQKRTADDRQTFLRKLALKVARAGKTGRELTPTELADFCDSERMPNGREVSNMSIGWLLKQAFGEVDQLQIEEWIIERRIEGEKKFYTFHPLDFDDPLG